jgi:hypothetical protein
MRTDARPSPDIKDPVHLLLHDGGEIQLLADPFGHESMRQVKTIQLGLCRGSQSARSPPTPCWEGLRRTSSLGRQYAVFGGQLRKSGLESARNLHTARPKGVISAAMFNWIVGDAGCQRRRECGSAPRRRLARARKHLTVNVSYSWSSIKGSLSPAAYVAKPVRPVSQKVLCSSWENDEPPCRLRPVRPSFLIPLLLN